MLTVSQILSARVADALVRAIREEGWQGEPASIDVERPANPEHGDYATSVAMRSARALRRPPQDIGAATVRRLPPDDVIANAEVAGKGFINLRLQPGWVARQAAEIANAGDRYGRGEVLAGERLQVEFISANPTGPLHLANARGGPLGDAIASVFASLGAEVKREFYVEDTGTQFEMFGTSIAVRYRQLLGEEIALPAEGYQGDYVTDIARAILAREGERYRHLPLEEQAKFFAPMGVAWVVEDDQRVCEKFGIRFDSWFSQAEMMRSGYFDATIDALRERGKVYEKDGAVWFDAPDEIEDKEGWVIVRSNGEPTYFGKDIAYHRLCLTERGLDRKLDIWGANTHYHLIQMRAAMRALGLEERFAVVLYQFVRFLHEDVILGMSRRRGKYITLEDVLDVIGKDATRFFLLQRSADAQLDFDFELAKQQSNENPVYYVQYAHARIASIFRTATERGVSWDDADATLLTEPAEQDLVKQCLRFPDLVLEIARHHGVHLLTGYALALAGDLHNFYKFNRVVGDDRARTKARLLLMRAVQVTLRRTLDLLGISAPDSM
jgi:arginyl-tRNA synthetase